MSDKRVPLAEVQRLRQVCRQLRNSLAISEAEKQGLRTENARLIAELQERGESRRPNRDTG